MNKKKKGDKAEREVYKIFESWDYIINPAPRTMRRIYVKNKPIYVSQRNDHWGLFDGEARNATHNILFQVKSNVSDVYSCKYAIEDFSKEYMKSFEIPQIWLRVPRKGWVVWEYDDVRWTLYYYNLKGDEVEKFKYS